MADDIKKLPNTAAGTSDGSLDQLVAGLSTLTPEDLESIRKVIYPVVGEKEPIDYSPRTLDYLKLVNALYRSGANSLMSMRSTKQLTRMQLYNLYDEMDEGCAYITAALDILSDDATQPDSLGNIYYIDSTNSKVKTVITNLFKSLEIENKISKWARAVAKYGDLFVKVYGSTLEKNRGVLSVDDTIYPSRVERKDYRGKLIAFKESGVSDYVEGEYCPPWDYVHFRHKGELAPTGDSTESELVSNYGQSILKGAIKTYNQLRFVENMVLLSRLTNSVRRNIFAINVGEVDPKAAFETIQNYANLLKKDIRLDLDNQDFSSARHSSTFDEDIFIPVSDPKNDFTIQSVGGDVNISEQYDLDYIQNKLFAALKIPKAYLNYEQDLNARSTLIQLDIRYARSVAQLQKTLIAGLTRLAKIHLAYIGIDPDTAEFEITMTSVSAIDEEARLEQLSNRINAANDFWNLITSVNDVLQQSKEAAAAEIEMPSDGGDDIDITNNFGGGSSISSGGGGPEEVEDLTVDIPEESPDLETPSNSPIQDMKSDIVQDSKKIKRNHRRINESIEEDKQLDRFGGVLNLEYITSKLFNEYLDFSEDEVNIILRRKSETELASNMKSIRDTRTRLRSSRLDDSELEYPTEFGVGLYEHSIKRIIEEASLSRDQEPTEDIDE